jgi:hypothetical protein
MGHPARVGGWVRSVIGWEVFVGGGRYRRYVFDVLVNGRGWIGSIPLMTMKLS